MDIMIFLGCTLLLVLFVVVAVVTSMLGTIGAIVAEEDDEESAVQRKESGQFRILFLYDRKLRPIIQKRSARMRTRRKGRWLPKQPRLGARMCQGTFFFM